MERTIIISISVFVVALLFALIAYSNRFRLPSGSMPMHMPSDDKIPKIVWIVWCGAIDDAPDIVQRCIRRVHALHTDWSIRVVTPDRYRTYVKCDRIIKLLESTIDHNFLSDLLRYYLLASFGGVYIDASVILTRNLDWVLDIQVSNPIMYMSDYWTDDVATPVLESWFIAARPGDAFMRRCAYLFRHLLEIGVDKSFKNLKENKRVTYGRFGPRHGSYHLCYFMMMYVNQHENYPVHSIACGERCAVLMSFVDGEQAHHDAVTHLFTDYKERASKVNMIKLAGYNRKYIEDNKVEPHGWMRSALYADLQS